MNLWDFLWLLIWTIVFVSYLMVLFNIIADLFRDPETSGAKKAIWVVLLLIAPAITAVVYLIIRGQGMAGRAAASAKQNEESARAYIRDAAGAKSPAEEIASAKALLDAGTITSAEFDQLKARALASA